MKNLISIFICGIIIGVSGTNTYLKYKEINEQNRLKFKIGDCLSNSLYSEKIIGIEKNSVSTSNYLYIIQGYINHKKLLPNKEWTHVIEDLDVLIDAKNCQ